MAKALACKATFEMIADKARHLNLAETGLLGGLVFPEAVDLGVEIVRVYLDVKEMSDWVAEDTAEAHVTQDVRCTVQARMENKIKCHKNRDTRCLLEVLDCAACVCRERDISRCPKECRLGIELERSCIQKSLLGRLGRHNTYRKCVLFSESSSRCQGRLTAHRVDSGER